MTAPNLVVVGSVAYDSIKTPTQDEKDVLGGSATYFSIASSVLVPTGVVAVVGDDFKPQHRTLLESRNVNLDGLETATGETFRWGGVYDKHLKDRETLFTNLNVFADFQPKLPESYKNVPYVFLANIDPDLQNAVLQQCTAPKWVACDTMNFWIHGKRESLLRLLPKIDALFLNDSEAFDLTGYRSLPDAAQWIADHGTPISVIKKGEHGAIIFSKDDVYAAPALPLRNVIDPTGAGDTFAGGMVAAIARLDQVTPEALRMAASVGTCTASFCIQSFGPSALTQMNREGLNERLEMYKNLTRFPEMTL